MKNNNFYTFGMIKPDGMSHKEDIIKMIYDYNPIMQLAVKF